MRRSPVRGVLLGLLTVGALAAADELIYRPVTIAVFPPLSTNGYEGKQVHTNVSIGIIGDFVGRLTGFQLGSCFTGVAGDATGVQFCGGGSGIGGSFNGVQLAGGANVVGRDAGFLQLAGAVNFVGRSMSGCQGAGAVNIVGERAVGLQIAGAVNIAGGHQTGVQLAGGANVAEGPAFGLQVAGGANIIGRSLTGVQLSGGANIAEEFTGMQAGVVNVCNRGHGLQIGLVNVDEDFDGIPVGMISIVRTGQFHVNAWADEVSTINLGIKSGTRSFYNVLMVGFDPVRRTGSWTSGVGLGGHFPRGRVFADIDGILSTVHHRFRTWQDSGTTFLVRLRANGGWQILPGLALVGGPQLTAYASDHEPAGSLPLFDLPIYQRESGDWHLRAWPGFSIGVQLM